MAAAASKGVRKFDRPRPLRSALSAVGDPSGCGTTLFAPAAGSGAVRASTELLLPVETLCASLGDGNRDAQTLSQIAGVCRLLKVRGADMDRDLEKMLDRCFAIFRNASRDDQLGTLDRLRLLEVIELRAMRWKGDEALAEYYSTRYAQFKNAECEEFDEASSMEEERLLQQVQPSEQRPQTDKPGTTADLSGQPKAPSTAADGETGEWEKNFPVGTGSLRICGMNETIVNVATSVLQTFFTNASVDAFCHANQTPSCVPSEPADALAGKAVAQPMNNISRPGDAADALCARNTSDTPGITNASENKGFVRLGSQTGCTITGKQVPRTNCKSWTSNDRPEQAKCFDRLGNSPQIPGRVGKERVFSTVSKTMGTASKLGPPEPFKGLGNPEQLSSGDDGRQFPAGFNALGSTGTYTQSGRFGSLKGFTQLSSDTQNQKLEPSGDFKGLASGDTTDKSSTGTYTQSGQFGSRKGLTQFSSDTENQKLEPSGDFKGLASGDTTDKSRQLSNLWYTAENFSTSDKQKVPTKALGNTDVPNQPKQSKGLGRPAHFSSKADDKWQPLPNAFTATTGGASGQNQTMKYERLGASVQSTSGTGHQTFSFGNKSLGITEGASKAKKCSTQSSGSAVKHGQQTGVKTPSVNGLPTEKQQPKVLESLAESGNSADKGKVPKRTLSPNHKVYSRDFLVQCSHSSLATEMPPDFPLLDPEVASAMVRKNRK